MSLPKRLKSLAGAMLFVVFAFWALVPAHAERADAPLHVNHEVKGSDVFIECFAPRFPFRQGSGGGHVDVYVNGQKVTQVYTAAFVVRGLPSGTHHIRLEFVYNDGRTAGVGHEFDVSIP
ncbi:MULTISPECIES: carbohydrate-binding protein [Geobacillus]|uniref:hypothetical protein n=1 Tax=Geobacillus TaxID=129337 RepID=UPI000501EA37